jgi:hypothetical protein
MRARKGWGYRFKTGPKVATVNVVGKPYGKVHYYFLPTFVCLKAPTVSLKDEVFRSIRTV